MCVEVKGEKRQLKAKTAPKDEKAGREGTDFPVKAGGAGHRTKIKWKEQFSKGNAITPLCKSCSGKLDLCDRARSLHRNLKKGGPD